MSSRNDIRTQLGDLAHEGESLDELVAVISDEKWSLPTSSAGWTIAHQIGHLLWTDRAALLAATNPDAFVEHAMTVAAAPGAAVEAGARYNAERSPSDLLDDWRTTRKRLAAAIAAVPPGDRMPWYGPPMKATSMATARLMETWAHGRDVADALGVRRSATPRLRNIAHLGVQTRDYSFIVNETTPPVEEFRVELLSPDESELWEWGPVAAEQTVTGPVEDFCLLVTRRAHRADLRLVARGADADAWLDRAQAFAGHPGTGRRPAGSATNLPSSM